MSVAFTLILRGKIVANHYYRPILIKVLTGVEAIHIYFCTYGTV